MIPTPKYFTPRTIRFHHVVYQKVAAVPQGFSSGGGGTTSVQDDTEAGIGVQLLLSTVDIFQTEKVIVVVAAAISW